MSSPDLFTSYPDDRLRIVRSYFESRNTYYFLEVIESLVARKGGGGNPCGCIFPEELDEYDNEGTEPFTGICCWYFEEEIIVSEQDFYNVMIMACEAYVKLNPKTKETVNRIISQWKFTEGVRGALPTNQTQAEQ